MREAGVLAALLLAASAIPCSTCQPTCSGYSVGQSWIDDYWVNQVQTQVTAVNPHNDCKFEWTLAICRPTGTALCYQTQHRWKSVILGGSWGAWSADPPNNTSKC